MLFVRVVGLTEIVEHGDRLDDPGDGGLAQGGNPGRSPAMAS